MANRLLAGNSRNLGRGIKTLSENTREYSSQSWRRKNTYVQQLLFGGQVEKSTIWPDPHLGCLGPKDNRLPLPGNIGVDKSLEPTEEPPTPERIQADKEELESQARFWRSLLGTKTNYRHQLDIMKQDYQNDRRDAREKEGLNKSLLDLNEKLECMAHDCPDLLRRELTGLFTNVNVSQGHLTVLTFCQKSKNDMTSWSSEVEEERDVLMENFIKSAREICDKLRSEGLWADFIEPASGRPFFGSYTNLTFFETDERYRHLGFQITDLGCCKVIAHHKWGTHAFVGSIFTSAPHDSEYLQQIVCECNKLDKS